MSTIRRTAALVTLLLAGALAGAACSPAAGPLGTPATPATSPAPSDNSMPTDVAPDSPSPSPTAVPSASPSEAPHGPSMAPSSPAPSTGASLAPRPTPSPSPAGTTTVRAYFMLGSFTDNPGLVPVLRTVPEAKAVAEAAMTALLAGPKGAELEASPAMYTDIPDGTRLLGINIKDGVATVNLSREFKGAAASFHGTTALAQVVYTVTQFPTVKLARIEIDGVSSGGALGRSDFQFQGILPAIFVDRPAWGAAAGNPVEMSGIANVFEARFRVQILDGEGNILADEPVTASCGTGCWGTFRASVPYDIAKSQYGTLRVFEPSAKDGSPVNVTEYRVWLTP